MSIAERGGRLVVEEEVVVVVIIFDAMLQQIVLHSEHIFVEFAIRYSTKIICDLCVAPAGECFPTC